MKSHRIILILALICIVLSCSDNAKSQKGAMNNFNEAFNPFGYYFPIKELRINNCLIDQLSIITNDKSNAIERIFIQLSDNKLDSIRRIEFTKFKLESKDLEMFANDPGFGYIVFKGIFTGEKGPSIDAIKNDDVVLKGLLKINSDPELKIEFTWFGGD